MNKKILGILLILTLCSQSAWAVFAPRAMGMGGAFTAIADDSFAAYWNPAGFAINPGIDFSGTYQLNNRNQQIGDNAFALKGCFEIGMNPFAWVAGVGFASILALEGTKYLSDKGIVKKGWGRSGEKTAKEESMATSVIEEEEKDNISDRGAISKKSIAKKAAKEVAKGTIYVANKYAKVALKEALRQSRHYSYAPPWHHPNYYQPTYWDNRYDYTERDLTPAGKAQFAGGITVMTDQNAVLDQDTNWYSFSLASGWGEIIALGTNLNIYDLKIPSNNVKGLGAGLDAGGLLRISDTLMFGVVAKEILTTDIHWENGTTTRYQTNVNVGAAIKPIRQITISGDLHNVFGQNGADPTTHYGIEVKPAYGLALRAGLSEENRTAGASIAIGQLIIDYAYLGGSYRATQIVGGTWKM